MKPAVAVIVFAGALHAQSASAIKSDLTDLMKLYGRDTTGREALSKRLAADLLVESPRDAHPSPELVSDLVQGLMAALTSRSMPNPKSAKPRNRFNPFVVGGNPLDETAWAILQVLQGDHLPEAQFRAAIESCRDGLARLFVPETDIERVCGALVLLGRQIRGPEQHTI